MELVLLTCGCISTVPVDGKSIILRNCQFETLTVMPVRWAISDPSEVIARWLTTTEAEQVWEMVQRLVGRGYQAMLDDNWGVGERRRGVAHGDDATSCN